MDQEGGDGLVERKPETKVLRNDRRNRGELIVGVLLG